MKGLQKEMAERFRKLHDSEDLLILPNIWEPLGACLLEDMGFPAVATGSASVAFTHGYDDGECIPLEDLLVSCRRIVNSVEIPLTVDMESGYACNDRELAENIKHLIETGVVGLNLEDTSTETGRMYTAEEQFRRIRLVRETSRSMGVPLFINARTDVFLHAGTYRSPQERLAETIRRGKAYKEAGADGFFPIFLTEEKDIRTLLQELDLPLNLLTVPGVPEPEKLRELGVARLSLGPGFLKIAVKAMRDTAMRLQNGMGLNSITENEITTSYLKKLIKKERS
ncbi:isocitrate lyase/PEP mutase family protein [Sinomicrobium weinanense]|uniref:Isocitrate lyase/phosphoenolpyruvate mutase family protein n=1 Tax=Sinomicrobium weinanense TaxID=2842200 RepID=A0A926JRJ5_9FLAO|nr:isocitrate lyase/phosphoenolpyruvate mutase family protein [Sinomicrobium weinanense]MBC9795936.1 isocitrate lyase/phosphoenolpyruvate mutase family protein [Sinomicrobium weinanense]MBU3124685.1 isocitrate lyase/phosphoenolpyruvate mutase family protein [Sinomicrobium weinanense]